MAEIKKSGQSLVQNSILKAEGREVKLYADHPKTLKGLSMRGNS